MSNIVANQPKSREGAGGVTEFIRREVANTASLYFAPVSAVARTVHDIWVASGSHAPNWWQSEVPRQPRRFPNGT